MRQNLQPGRLTLVAMACGVLLVACGGGGGSGGSEGKLQTITFDYPGGGTLLSGPRTLHATTTSGLPVTYSSTTPTTCTVEGDQMTMVAAGECRVVASQSGGTTSDGTKWAPADEVSQLFNVLKHAQDVTLNAPDYLSSTGVSEGTVTTSASSGLSVTLTVATPTVCSVTGTTLKALTKGSCQITATQSGDANYDAVTVNAYVAVDPLIVADGILGAGQGSTNSAVTKQGGAVSANPYSSLVGGWEWCDPANDDQGNLITDRCFRTVSADERTFTSSIHVKTPSQYESGWWEHSGNNIDIFAPGLSGFNDSGDTTGGLQVTTETLFGMGLGVNPGLYKAKKPVVLHLDLGKRNNGCNVTVSTLVWPSATYSSVGIELKNFAVTEACGLSDVATVSVDDDIRKLPNPWGTGAGDAASAEAAYQAALDTDKMKAARASAWTLFQSSNIVRVRLRMPEINLTDEDVAGDGVYATDLSVVGAIKIQ